MSNCLFPIETHLICDFQEESGPPAPPPLDPHLVQPSQLHGEGYNTLSHLGLANVNRQKNVSSFYCYIPYNKCLL